MTNLAHSFLAIEVESKNFQVTYMTRRIIGLEAVN